MCVATFESLLSLRAWIIFALLSAPTTAMGITLSLIVTGPVGGSYLIKGASDTDLRFVAFEVRSEESCTLLDSFAATEPPGDQNGLLVSQTGGKVR